MPKDLTCWPTLKQLLNPQSISGMWHLIHMLAACNKQSHGAEAYSELEMTSAKMSQLREAHVFPAQSCRVIAWEPDVNDRTCMFKQTVR